ncbi:MAG: type I-E CRISPR-associated endoribonuclease Cas2e [Myxococcota bacterium]
MPMTVVVTRNATGRIRGFLASCMCEIAPGVYTAPRMNKAVRERVWTVLDSWFGHGSDMAIVMTWPDRQSPGGQGVLTLGVPRKEIVDYEGVFLTRRTLPPTDDVPF